MANVQYRCLSCGSVHETSVRPGGAVYLRCAVTREWAWHEPSRFLNLLVSAQASPRGRARSSGTGRKNASPRPATRSTRGRSAATVSRTAARTAAKRKSAGKPASGKGGGTRRRKR